MSEQIQRQPQRREAEEVTTEETTFDRSTTDEVIEGCDNCLANIDEVLDEVKDRELTDSEVYDAGEPDERDFMDQTRGYWEWKPGGEDAYYAALERFEQAYENVTGMSVLRVGRCGC